MKRPFLINPHDYWCTSHLVSWVPVNIHWDILGAEENKSAVCLCRWQGLKMPDLHFLVCVKVWNETQADPWETMQPLMGLGGWGWVRVLEGWHRVSGVPATRLERERNRGWSSRWSSAFITLYRHLGWFIAMSPFMTQLLVIYQSS